MEGFRPMRRKRQELQKDVCEEILRRRTAGVLALWGDEGYPYAVPMSYAYEDGCLYFHSAKEGHKVDAVRRNAKASFCVIDADDVKPDEYTTYYRSVIAFGQIAVIEDADEREQAANLLGEKYNPNEPEALQKEKERGLQHMLALKLRIEYLSGKEAKELVRQREQNV